MPKKRNVLFDHDGGVDDLLSLMLLLTMPHINLVGLVVTPADCYLRPAVSASFKILRFFNRLDIEVSTGMLHGVNAFPRAWRTHAYVVDVLPILNETPWQMEPPQPLPEAGHQFIARKLRESHDPLTILVTGPLSNLAKALKNDPELSQKIEEVIWMGGALNVPGNVRDYEHSGSAEWNAYWDPPAVHSIWQTDVPLTLFPLDATNQVRVTLEFLHRLAGQRRYPLSDLAGQCWALTVGAIPAYEYIYHMWDTLTTAYLGIPQAITIREATTHVIDRGPDAGTTQEIAVGGKRINVADQVHVENFYNYILHQFQR